ncbi:sel1 repeat family protein [Terasakiella sp. SH-1]|uniref:tetratricopeptide repeat protein n=1 Tax=Terasakiella sp. SH-1 TaxID=2560057 RepID=UPI001073C88A|nr:sel1 repeat family protein [Terasakiella sp. SH-1]
MKELEQIPSSQKSADIYMEMAGIYLILEGTQDKIIEAYINASNAGDSRATYNLAVLSGYGKNVGKQLPSYEVLFEKAAQQGSLSAAFTIKARDILKTPHMPPSYEAAAIQLEGVSKDNIEAAFALCSHGKEAISKIFAVGNMNYCEGPINAGYAPAQYFMGRMYEQNPAEFHPETWSKNGLEQNLDKAKEFYERAASQSYSPAIKRLELLSKQVPLTIIKAKDKYAYLPDINPDWFD